MSEKSRKLLEDALESGEMSQVDHDRFMTEIHRDGQIDSDESALMSRMFEAMRSGELKISTDGTADNSRDRRDRERLKKEALERNTKESSPPSPHGATAPGGDQESLGDKQKIFADDLPLPESEESPQGFPGEEKQDAQNLGSLFRTVCKPRSEGPHFLLNGERLLDVRLEGKVWTKTGSMVGYYGNIKFTREGIMEHGVSKMLQKSITGEGASLTKAIGSGNLYLADQGKKISVLELNGQSISVNGSSILAFEDSIEWNISMLKQVAAIAAGGLFNVKLRGNGVLAISSHFDPIVLEVTPGRPVTTDINATVAWTSSLSPKIRTDIGKQTLIGRGSGETLQMHFQGEGHVVIQPYENNVESE